MRHSPQPKQLTRWMVQVNCLRLGIPMPAIAFAPIPNYYVPGGLAWQQEHFGSWPDPLEISGSASPAYVFGTDGVSLIRLNNDVSTTKNRLNITSPPRMTKDMTIFAVVYPRRQSSGVDVSACSVWNGGGAGTGEWNLGLNYGNATPTDYRPFFTTDIASTLVELRDTTTGGSGQWATNDRLVLAGRRAGTQQSLWRGGVKVAETTCGSGSFSTSTEPFRIGGIGFSAANNTQEDLEVVYLWDSAIPDRVIAALSADPLMLFNESPELEEFLDGPYGLSSHNYFPTNSLTTNLVMDHAVVRAFGLERTVDEALSRVGLGGRQTIRMGTRIYTVGVDGSKTYVLYSDDEGASWTTEEVVAWPAVGACIYQGVSSLPILMITKAGTNEIRTYARGSGGGWTHTGDIGTGNIGALEGFQGMYDGGSHHVVYATNNASTGRRQVRYAFSINTASWTSVLIDNGDTSGVNAGTDRGLAACLDTDGDIHLVYTQRVGGAYSLRYSTYDGAVWSTPEEIEALGSTYRAKHLSIAVDADLKPHVTGVIESADVDQVFYTERTGSEWSARVAPAENTGAAQSWPSMGFEDRRFPVIVFSGQFDEDEGTVHRAKLGLSETWVRSVMAEDATATKTEQLYDPFRPSSVTMQGSFIVFQSSIMLFVTSLIVWGDELTGSADALLSQVINLKGFGSSTDDLEMSQVVSDPTHAYTLASPNVARTAGMSQIIARLMAYARSRDNTALLGQEIDIVNDVFGGGALTYFDGAFQWLEFTQTVDRVLDSRRTVTNTPTFSQIIGLTHPTINVSSDLEMSQNMTKGLTRNLTATQNLSMAQVVFLNKILNLRPVSSLLMGQGTVRIRSWVWNSTHYNPGWTAEYESDVTDFIILGPDEAPTIEMTLPKPDFDDVEDLNWRPQSVRRNRSGRARVFRPNIYAALKFDWSGLLRKRADEFRNIIKTLVGKNVRIRDHNGVWKHVVITSDKLTRSQSGPEFCNVTIQFEEKESVA